MTAESKAFSLQLDKEWLAMQEDVAETVSMIGMEALRRVVLRSPVDTGRFKGNWDLGVGTIPGSVYATMDPSGGVSLNRGTTALGAYPDTLPQINIVNNLPYAVPLENGHSQQAPGGMVAITVAELEAAFAVVEV